MSVRFARFLLLFAALWLPVQTMAALSMPLCRHAQEHVTAAVKMDSSAMESHGHEAAAPDQSAQHDVGCDNCELCHLACAGFMPSTPLVTSLVTAGHSYTLPPVTAPPSYIAEPPQHPPRGDA